MTKDFDTVAVTFQADTETAAAFLCERETPTEREL